MSCRVWTSSKLQCLLVLQWTEMTDSSMVTPLPCSTGVTESDNNRHLSTRETLRRGGSTRTHACHCDVLDQQQTLKFYFWDVRCLPEILMASGFLHWFSLKPFLLFQTFPLRQNEIKPNKIYTVWWILTKNKHIKHKDHIYKLVEHTTVRYTFHNVLPNLYGHFNDNFKKK